MRCIYCVQEEQKRSGKGMISASLPAPAATDKKEEDDLRNLILIMVDEPLAIVVKLADRLHNMRTVWALPPAKARAVATETLRVWCSLAERLGMFAVKVRSQFCTTLTECPSHPGVPHPWRVLLIFNARNVMSAEWSARDDGLMCAFRVARTTFLCLRPRLVVCAAGGAGGPLLCCAAARGLCTA